MSEQSTNQEAGKEDNPEKIQDLADKDLMADRFDRDQVSKFKDSFSLFDTDNDGRITIKEVGVVMRSLGIKLTEKQLIEMTDEVDTQKTGKIDFPEFLTMMALRYHEDDDDVDDLRQAFKVFDKEGHGLISAAEFRRLMVSLGETLGDSEADKLIKEADLTGDGLIDYEEFIQRLCKKS